jgi:KaiC/GvpD/RAD55 family RecA-like ATPase
MYRNEVNEQSPMRVFERSIRGGLGVGNVGVIVSRPGVGKTALLVQIALDDLLRDRRVLHISHEHPVEHVRAFYDELFHDIAVAHHLVQPQVVRLEIERNRLIYSHRHAATENPPSRRGGSSSVSRIEQTIMFARDMAHFEAHTIIIDGFDFDNASPEALATLRALAERLGVEMWLSAKTEENAAPQSTSGPASVPSLLRRFYEDVAVIVQLRTDGRAVHLQLLKDHDNLDVGDLSLRLDPTTMRVVDSDLPKRQRAPKDPKRFHLVSGGARGAEAVFGKNAERWGVKETHYSFDGHPFLERERGVIVLDELELAKGDFSLVYASHRLGRPLSEIPNIRRILQTAWHQITAASEVFVVGAIQENGTVRGGTGWGAELARLWSKPVCVFDQVRGGWWRWDATTWRKDPAPVIERVQFAGIGTTNLTGEGTKAIEELFERSFGA